MYSTAVFNPLHIISFQQLLYWIHSKAKCMRKLGSDVVIVMGDGDKQFNLILLRNNYMYVTAILGVDKDIDITTHLNDTLTDQIILLPKNSIHHSQGNLHIASLKINLIQSNFTITSALITL